jgi:hypothetical protein
MLQLVEFGKNNISSFVDVGFWFAGSKNPFEEFKGCEQNPNTNINQLILLN